MGREYTCPGQKGFEQMAPGQIKLKETGPEQLRSEQINPGKINTSKNGFLLKTFKITQLHFVSKCAAVNR